MSQETAHLRRQLALLTELHRELNLAASEADVMHLAARYASRIIDCERASLAMIAPDGEHFEVFAFQGESGVIPVGALLPLSRTGVGMVVRDRRVVNCKVLVPDEFEDHQALHKAGLGSCMGAPLITSTDVVGTLNVAHRAAHAYADADELLFEQLASVLAASIENRRLFARVHSALHQTEEYADKLAQLNELGRRLSGVTSEGDVLRVMGEFVPRVLPADRISVALVEPDGEHLRRVLMDGGASGAADPGVLLLPIANTMAGGSFASGMTQVHGDLSILPEMDAKALSSMGMYSGLLTPIVVANRAIGTLNMAHRERHAFTARDQALLEHAAAFLGAALENVRLYHETRVARDEAEAASLAKSTFLATMSHEIRTPLNAVIGLSGLLLESRLSERQREYTDAIRISGDALLALVNDILDFSKIEAGRVELEQRPFKIRTMVEESLDIVAMRASAKGLELCYIANPGMPERLVGDITRVRQVLVNLLSNAVKFTDKGEVVVEISASAPRAPEPDRQEPDASVDITISVRDTGIGIPADRLDRLFVDFGQLDASVTRRYGGTGLGLTISKRLADLMGGQLTVHSEFGRGSRFTFTFTCGALPSGDTETDRDRRIREALTGVRVLLVDDSALHRRVLGDLFQAWGMKALVVANDESARARLANPAHDWDLLFVDKGCLPALGDLLLRNSEQDGPPVLIAVPLGDTLTGSHMPFGATRVHKPIKPSLLQRRILGSLGVMALHTPADVEPVDDGTPAVPLRILIAEDNALNQRVLVHMLERIGYRADVAANGLEVLDAITRQDYDVILMDVHMPEMSGIQATEAVRARLPRERQPHIIAVTADAFARSRERLMSAGVDDFASKPIRMPDLIRVLERAIEQRTP